MSFPYIPVDASNPAHMLTAIIDIAIVAFLVYKAISLFRGTSAVSLIKGLAILIAAYAVSEYLKLDALYWLLKQFTTMALVGIPVVFQPELRRGLEQLGKGSLIGNPMRTLGLDESRRVIDEIVKAAFVMSGESCGALIIVERDTGLGDVMDTGVRIDGAVSSQLLVNIFTPYTPLHDGAVIVRGNRIMAASCVLPLSQRQTNGKKIGTRHRAAYGIAELTDAVAVVVSEETGTVSCAYDGDMVRGLTPEQLHTKLYTLFELDDRGGGMPWRVRGSGR